jgi:hypothetical protein
VEITSSGTLLLADLNFTFNKQFSNYQLGVNVTRCPAGVTSPAGCTTAFLDSAGADRQWITSAGSTVWVSYHDSNNSTLIRVKRSTDDGRTWSNVGSPTPGEGTVTAQSTFNNDFGPIVADPTNGTLYTVYASGETQTKATGLVRNNVYVSRSTDGGRHWTSTLVLHAAPTVQLANLFPALTVDPVTHRVYTAWATDTHGVSVSSSGDAGVTWSAPKLVSSATTTVMPWIAARNGKVDVVYYGSGAASTDDPTAVWNVYDSQLSNGTWTIKQVSNTPNRIGAVCLNGFGCTSNRELLDLFEVALDPNSGRAAVVYTDTTMSTWTGDTGTAKQLPQIVLAFER